MLACGEKGSTRKDVDTDSCQLEQYSLFLANIRLLKLRHTAVHSNPYETILPSL